ncbi:hypothetical protein E3T49_02625 [Cryobacterium cryoconiti]|uniref:Uncharacterized protein n=1 Tax=Cryobacterium cryoconiti TaxID=1259239 RepID=A0A4Y8K268_9MICO|nr:hypothetical protein E3T49_02625 [Cryobacterium cryoconiti]
MDIEAIRGGQVVTIPGPIPDPIPEPVPAPECMPIPEPMPIPSPRVRVASSIMSMRLFICSAAAALSSEDRVLSESRLVMSSETIASLSSETDLP